MNRTSISFFSGFDVERTLLHHCILQSMHASAMPVSCVNKLFLTLAVPTGRYEQKPLVMCATLGLPFYSLLFCFIWFLQHLNIVGRENANFVLARHPALPPVVCCLCPCYNGDNVSALEG